MVMKEERRRIEVECFLGRLTASARGGEAEFREWSQAGAALSFTPCVSGVE